MMEENEKNIEQSSNARGLLIAGFIFGICGLCPLGIVLGIYVACAKVKSGVGRVSRYSAKERKLGVACVVVSSLSMLIWRAFL